MYVGLGFSVRRVNPEGYRLFAIQHAPLSEDKIRVLLN